MLKFFRSENSCSPSTVRASVSFLLGIVTLTPICAQYSVLGVHWESGSLSSVMFWSFWGPWSSRGPPPGQSGRHRRCSRPPFRFALFALFGAFVLQSHRFCYLLLPKLGVSLCHKTYSFGCTPKPCTLFLKVLFLLSSLSWPVRWSPAVSVMKENLDLASQILTALGDSPLSPHQGAAWWCVIELPELVTLTGRTRALHPCSLLVIRKILPLWQGRSIQIENVCKHAFPL